MRTIEMASSEDLFEDGGASHPGHGQKGKDEMLPLFEHGIV
jgi:hypothetical protein